MTISRYRWPRLIGAALLGLLAACAATPPAREDAPVQLSIRGRITPELVDQLAPLFPPHGVPARAVVYLASGGGDFAAAMTLARWLEGMPRTTVVVTRECDSACLIVFAAARERLVDARAVFGAHGPECTAKGLVGLPCRMFWEPWARGELHDRVARISPSWAAYLDGQEPPAFLRSGADFVRVTGDQLIAFGAATPLSRNAMQAALTGE